MRSAFYQFDFAFSNGTIRVKDWSQEQELWSPGASCDASQTPQLKMQADGNLVLYCSGAAAWDSGTADPSLEEEAGENILLLQENGNLAIVNKRGEVTWSSNSKVAYDYFSDDLGIYDTT